MVTNVAVLDDYEGVFARPSAMRSLRDVCEISIHSTPVRDRRKLVERLERAKVIVAVRERTVFPKEVLESLEALRPIVQTGTGVAHVDLETARERGIMVSNMPGVSGAPVAKITLLSVLSWLRGLPGQVSSMREGRWVQKPGREIVGKIFGIVGYGSIGKEVARLAKAFRAKVLAWSPGLTAGRAWRQEITYMPLEQLLAHADILLVHLSAVPEFRRLLDRERLETIKRGSVLINTSRPELVDMEATVDLRKKGHLASAAFDVFDTEPLPPDHPARKLPNLTLTPHIGWATQDLLDRFAAEAAEKVKHFVEGRTVPDVCETSRARDAG